MAHIIDVRNVNEAVTIALQYMRSEGIQEDSRNGTVIVAPGPVMTVYQRPQERVLFSRVRNANPFFHLMEALWMLNGQNDLEWPLFFNARFSEYSDDQQTIHGAYGHRWRKAFGFDQVKALIHLLRTEPETRRGVLAMWNPQNDLGTLSRDLPCNTHIYFDRRGGVLNMTVCCRSNDLLWGAYGANVVHFSMLQEYIACALGIPMGEYCQLSNNFHYYTNVLDKEAAKNLEGDAQPNNHYEFAGLSPSDLFVRTDRPLESMASFDIDLKRFMSDPMGDTAYEHVFFNKTAAPMYAAWYDRKTKTSNGLMSAYAIEAEDWREACVRWINRADKRAQEKVHG